MRDIVFRTIMLKGSAGNDIVSIEKTSTQGAVDTYTITLSDGSTETFNVTNGTSIASIEKTSTSGLIDTYTITLTDGSTSTFEVANGENAQVYEIPKDSVIGFDSEDATPAGYDEISSPYDAALSATSDNAVQNKAVKAAIDSLTTAVNSLSYHRGDVIKPYRTPKIGYITGSNLNIYISIPLSKPVGSDVTGATVTGTITIRGVGGYVGGSSGISLSDTSVVTGIAVYGPWVTSQSDNDIVIVLTLASAPSGATNNTPLAIYFDANARITFS